MEGQIFFVRNFKNGKGWEMAAITDKENQTIQDALRKTNNQIYKECLRDARQMLIPYMASYSNPLKHLTDTAIKLFEKRAIHSLTAYQEFLKDKVEKMRNGGGEAL